MTAPVSVIIPTLNAAAGLTPTLMALADAAVDGLIHEVILVDGGSDDDIAELADGVGARLVTAPRGRGAQLAAGAAAARGDWFMFLHADAVPEGAWIDAVQRHTAGATDRAGYFDLRFRSPHTMARIVAGWANLRARTLALPYGDQGLLIHRSLYTAVGGYPAVPLMEDVALARKLRRRLCPIGAVMATSARRYEQNGWMRQGWRNLGTLALYTLGRDPVSLAERYNRTPPD